MCRRQELKGPVTRSAIKSPFWQLLCHVMWVLDRNYRCNLSTEQTTLGGGQAKYGKTEGRNKMLTNKIDSTHRKIDPQPGFEGGVGSSRRLARLYHEIRVSHPSPFPLALSFSTYLDVAFIPTVWYRDGEVEIGRGLRFFFCNNHGVTPT
jgi:hypothetical protein